MYSFKIKMKISKVYKSKLPYQWEAGKHKSKAHKKAIAASKSKLPPKRKVSALGWPM
jgi:hypothetical protein